MKTLAILLVLAASGCVSAFDHERVRGELSATRDENSRLRAENDVLKAKLNRAGTRLDMIDRILHEDGPADAFEVHPGPDAR